MSTKMQGVVPHVSSSADEIQEEPEYVNLAERAENNVPATPRDKFLSYSQSFAPLAACWLILLMIIILHIYFTSVMSENNTKLTAENQRLTKINQEVETERKNLTEQIETMEKTWIDLSVSRTQWIIDAYCPQNLKVRTCEPCQQGWLFYESNCYEYNDAPPSSQIRWEDAQKDCRGKISVLTVVDDKKEKDFIEAISFPGPDEKKYWIGLKAEEEKWKWTDGSYLTDNDWISPPANDSLCVVSVKNQGWKPVSCEEKNAWICEKKALSL
ncbi:C-type lectin domain family 12 member B-like [Nematolebias whitei]|uniref:C-type lectin domain family 12 member B-like n=1 Tax=Nematolebias whitei TaxID=451745 RepID=UPI0018993701|nr:C-type lectin domain family 12 member B-like [Nematolebias whitei]